MKIIDNLISVRAVARLLGCSVSTTWRRVADGTIPRPIKIGRTSRWPKSEIEAVIERAKDERDAA